MRVLIVVNSLKFFLSHRLPIALEAIKQGHEVSVAANFDCALPDDSNGIQYIDMPFSRSGQNLFYEFKTFLALRRLFKSVRPDIVHLVTIKPVLYGGLCARLCKIKGTVAAISGLGSVFSPSSLLGKLRKQGVILLYRLALARPNVLVIFQNGNDRQIFLENGVIDKTQSRMIKGSGIDLEQYRSVPEPDGQPIAVMASRLLIEKGVLEFVEAARILRQRGVNATMRLIGDPDFGNPSSVTKEELDRWREEGIVELLGYRSDIDQQYSAAHIVTLPSFYGEGLPKALIEAAACGRAVVTTDHPGCRDAIDPDKTGLLVPTKNSEALADALERLITDSSLRNDMGQKGRAWAEEQFSIQLVVSQHLEIYAELAEHG